MKKTLAIAIAAGLAAPMAVMADTTLYGSAHASLDSVDLVSSGRNTALSNNKSYLGVKGSEKISDGLSAIYKAEFSVGYNENSSFGNRDQWLGLAGSAGKLGIGRASTPYKGVAGKADLFWFSQLGSNRTINGPDNRLNHVLWYQSPKMGGFQTTIAHVFEDANSNFTANSANFMYKAGGLLVGLGLEDSNATGDDVDSRLMASYDTGKFKVVGFLENHDGTASAATPDTKVAGIGASVKTAKGVVKGQYYTSDPDGNNNDASSIAVGYDHNLSKRTTVYAIYAAVDNDTGSSVALGTGGGHSENVAAAAGEDQKGISLGIRHKF